MQARGGEGAQGQGERESRADSPLSTGHDTAPPHDPELMT